MNQHGTLTRTEATKLLCWLQLFEFSVGFPAPTRRSLCGPVDAPLTSKDNETQSTAFDGVETDANQ